MVEPLLSLIYNQVQSLIEHGIAADYIEHFRKEKDVDTVLCKAEKGKLTFLYVTPKRLQSHDFQETILNVPINLIVIDECHCVTEWGTTFRDAYLEKDVTSDKKKLEDRLEKRFKVLDKCIKKYHSDGSVMIYTSHSGFPG